MASMHAKLCYLDFASNLIHPHWHISLIPGTLKVNECRRHIQDIPSKHSTCEDEDCTVVILYQNSEFPIVVLPVSDQEHAAPAEKWQQMDISETSLTPMSTTLATSPTGQQQSKKCPIPQWWQQWPWLSAAEQQQPSLTTRFIPRKGVQYLPQENNDPLPYNHSTSQGSFLSPLSPMKGRPIQPQQGNFYPQQMQCRSSDAPIPNLRDVGHGVPLSSAPASWPLYIIKFKAIIQVIWIAEGDHGKNLGTVINDSITLKEVAAIMREQRERVAYGDGGPLSPDGQQGSKMQINPKMIYGKAQPQDRQYSFLCPVVNTKFLPLGLCRQLPAKAQDESSALQLYQKKVRQKKLPTEVIDAEYQ
ncbi:hypothetical protein EDD16DRAFT_1752417 [Pisolithus croceorrhizus]|nr:hypothetical protein EDD16DRAFT_1752417 [Pisolithus croceorrhizus]